MKSDRRIVPNSLRLRTVASNYNTGPELIIVYYVIDVFPKKEFFTIGGESNNDSLANSQHLIVTKSYQRVVPAIQTSDHREEQIVNLNSAVTSKILKIFAS